LLAAAGVQEQAEELLLKVPHHGGNTSLTVPVLEAVSAEWAVISVGADNRSGHPDGETLEKLEGVPTYRTDLDGNIEVVIDGQRYWVVTER
jgi:competence protein ComEC